MDVLKSDLAARFLAGEPVIFMVDAQTSKPKISINLMDKVDDILKHTTLAKHCIMILCSRRMELAVAVGILCSRCMEWCNTGSEEAS